MQDPDDEGPKQDPFATAPPKPPHSVDTSRITTIVIVVLPLALSAMFIWVMLREPEVKAPPLPSPTYIPELDGVMAGAECQSRCIKTCMELGDPDQLSRCVQGCDARCLGGGTGGHSDDAPRSTKPRGFKGR